METTCYRCNATLTIDGKVGRRDSCPKCGISIHSCKFCGFYEPKAYNECRETSADRVVDKEKENYCDFFMIASLSAKSVDEAKLDAKKKLDTLFK